MGLGGDPEGRPFDWLADIKLNNGLTLATRLYYKHTLTYRQVLLRHVSIHLYTLIPMYQDGPYFSQAVCAGLTELNIKSLYHSM